MSAAETITTTQVLVRNNNKKPSERLQELINQCANGFQKLGETIELTLQVGREEGFADRETN